MDTSEVSLPESPDLNMDLSRPEKAKSKKAMANTESPVIKSHDVFGAVKIKDGLFLGDQYSP